MKKSSPVVIASSLLVVLLAINAILLATRKPTTTHDGVSGNATTPSVETNAAANASAPAGTPSPITTQPFTVEGTAVDRQDNSIEITFSGISGDIVTPEGYPGISVSPTVAGKIELKQWTKYNGRRVLNIEGAFQPEVTYSVRIPAGLTDSASNKLSRAVALSVRIPPKPTEIDFHLSGLYMQSKGARKIPIRLTNASRVEFTLQKHYDNNLNVSFHPWYCYGENSHWDSEMLVDVASMQKTFNIPRNKQVDATIDLRELFGDIPCGIYRLLAKPKGADNHWYSASTWFAISDIAVQAVIDANGRKASVFARTISDDTPVANADVRIFSTKNQVIAEGRTDANGCAMLRFMPKYNLSVDEPKSVIVATDTDMTFEMLSDGYRSDSNLHPKLANARTYANHPEALMFAERGIYRPGETIFASTFVRKIEAGATRAVSGSPIVFVLCDPMDNEVGRVAATTDAHGFAEASFKLGQDAKTGSYSIICRPADQVQWGRTKVLVSAFVPDRIKAALKSDIAPRTAVSPDDAIKYTTSANYYFGTPVESFDFDFSAVLEPMPTLPEHMKGWKIGESANTRLEIDRSTGKGSNQMEIEIGGLDRFVGKAFSPQLIKAWNDVSEIGGRAVTAFGPSIPFHPTPSYIGLRHVDGGQGGDVVELALVPAIAGDAVKPLPVNVALVRKEWEFEFYEDRNKTRRRWVEKSIDIPTFNRELTATGDIAKLSLNDLPFGRYELVATAQDRKNRLEFWHDAGEGGIRSGDPNVVEFKLDAESYKPGDVARITFESIGAGEAFIVCGESAIDANTSFKVKAGTNAFDFQVPPSIVGNAYHFGVTIVSRDINNILQRQFGLLSLAIDQSRFGMSVALDAPEKTEPKSEIEVKVHLRDSNGAPVSGLVRLYAVDEGILSLTKYATPDPLAFFHCGRFCEFKFFDLYDDIIPELAITPDRQIGGDAFISAANRSKIDNMESAVVVSAPIEVGDTGDAAITLKLPNHTGELRIMAVAAGERLLGSAQRPLVMRDVATATASAPRAVAPDDEFDVTCKLFNHECEDGRFAFALSLPDGIAPAYDAAKLSWSGNLQRGSSSNIVVRMRAGDASTFRNLSITNTLAIDGHSFLGETYVTIRPLNPPMTASKTIRINPSEEIAINSNPDDWQGDTASTIEVLAHPATGLRDAATWLNGYPYGCLEQTTSSVFPLLAADSLAKAGLIDPEIAQTAKEKIAAGIVRIKSMQLADGSFAMWPGADYSADGYVVLYAAHFLIEAHRHGFSPNGIDGSVANYIRKTFIDSTVNHADSGNSDVADTFLADFEQAYAAYLLVLAGKGENVVATLRNLMIGEGDNLSCYKVLAATALAKAGYAGEAAAVLRTLVNSDDMPISDLPRGCHLSYMDQTSIMGLILNATMEVLPDPATATRLAGYIASRQRADDSAWGTPHANAWAMLGLARYCAICKPGDVDFAIKANGRESQRITLPATGDKHSFAAQLGNGGTVLHNYGQAPIFAVLRTRGIPRNPPATGGNVKIKREIFDEGGKLVSGTVAHGDLLEVRISIENEMELDEAILCDILPGGLEIEDERLATRANAMTRSDKSKMDGIHAACIERGDDRFLLFADIEPGKHSVSYRVRAVTPGRYTTAPVRIECMYNPDITGTFYDGMDIAVER